MELFKGPSSGPRGVATGGQIAVFLIGYEVWGVVAEDNGAHGGQDLAPGAPGFPQRPATTKRV